MDSHISRSSILYGSAEDIWPDMENLYRDQLNETCQKLAQLDDEIWGKIILMERNKRVAKAYIRAQVVTVDGAANSFDGYRLGFAAFENPFRDKHIYETHAKIGQGVRLKMDQQGNILAKKDGSGCTIFVQGISHLDQSSPPSDLIKSNSHLPNDKAVKVFDMSVFKNAIRSELQQSFHDRKKLLFKTVIAISFGRTSSNPLNTPCWFLLINLVAVDMLNSQLPSQPTYNPSATMCRRTSEGILPDLSNLQHHSSNTAAGDLYASVASLAAPGWPSAASSQQQQQPAFATYASPSWYDIQQPAMIPSDQLVQLANALALGFQPGRPNLLDNQAAAAAMLWQRQQNAAAVAAAATGYMSECETVTRARIGRPRSETGFRPLNRGWPPAQSTESLYGPLGVSNIPPSSNFTLRPKAPLSCTGAPTKKLFNPNQCRNLKPSNWSSGSMSDYDFSQNYDSSPYSSNTSAASGRPSSPSIVSEVSASESPSDSGFTEGSNSARSVRVRANDMQFQFQPNTKPLTTRNKKNDKSTLSIPSNGSSLSSSPSSSSSSTVSSASLASCESDNVRTAPSTTRNGHERPTNSSAGFQSANGGRAPPKVKAKPGVTNNKPSIPADSDQALVVRF